MLLPRVVVECFNMKLVYYIRFEIELAPRSLCMNRPLRIMDDEPETKCDETANLVDQKAKRQESSLLNSVKTTHGCVDLTFALFQHANGPRPIQHKCDEVAFERVGSALFAF